MSNLIYKRRYLSNWQRLGEVAQDEYVMSNNLSNRQRLGEVAQDE